MKNMPQPGDAGRLAFASKSGAAPRKRVHGLTESQRIALLHRFGGDRKAMREAAARLTRFAVPAISEPAG